MSAAASDFAPLEEVGSHLAAIVASTQDAIFCEDLNGIITSWNTGAERLFGYRGEEAIGKPISMLVPGDRAEELAEIVEKIRSGEIVERFETARKHKDGSELHVAMTVHPIRDPLGRIVSASNIVQDVSERKRLESAFQRLAAIVEDSDDAIISKDLNGIITSWNRGAQRIFGYTAGEVIGQPVSILALPERRDEMPAILARIRRGERVDHYETVRVKKDGTAIDVSLTVSPVRNRSGEIIGASKIARDITGRKQGEAALERANSEIRQSEELFRTTANAIPHLCWVANPDGAAFWYNTRWYEYTGTPAGQADAFAWQHFIEPGLLPQMLARWKASRDSGDPVEMVAPICGADGGLTPFLIRILPVRDEEFKIIRWFGTATDISGQQSLLRREQEARQTAELLNGIGPMLLSEFDPRKLSRSIIELTTRLIGAEFGALYRNPAGEADPSSPIQSQFEATGETGFPLPAGPLPGLTFSGHGLLRIDDITQHPAYGTALPSDEPANRQKTIRSYLAAPIQARSGEVLGGLFFGHRGAGKFRERHERIVKGIAAQAAIAIENARLFSEKEQTRIALQRSNEHLQRANADLEQFAYSASHDLQEPIRNIAIYAEILEKHHGQVMDDDAHECLKVVREGAHRMEMLVRDILAYTRIGSNDEKPLELVDVNSVLAKALANLSEAIRESSAQIVAVDLPHIWIYEVHLQQIFQNLVGNAIKYRGTAAPEVYISADKMDGEWRFAVRDNGIGISPHHKEKIFGIFKRLHSANERSGTGIGLAICKRLVERYSGRIWLESEPGKGSTFYFTLPGAGQG